MTPFRRVALQLHYDLPRPENRRSVLIAAPLHSDLCAFSSVALATCMAEQILRPVLLVDVCPRNPDVGRVLHCVSGRGFTDLLGQPSLSLEEVVFPTNQKNVYFLSVGSDLSSAPQATQTDINVLLQAAEERYEFVVLSAGSVLHDPLALAMVPFVGQVLLLVTENDTKIDDLDAAQDAIALHQARRVGLLLTTPARASGQARAAAVAESGHLDSHFGAANELRLRQP
jgi:Mrp family chromosome partitioning ATPase